MSLDHSVHSRNLIALPLAIALACSTPAFLFAQAGSSGSGKTRSMAEAQHEIVMLLIQKKEYAKAAAEANRIFDMNWPSAQEPLLLKELLFLSDQFLHQDQAALGIQILETNVRAFKDKASLVEIMKEKGYLYKKMGQNDKALEAFREARRLEKALP